MSAYSAMGMRQRKPSRSNVAPPPQIASAPRHVRKRVHVPESVSDDGSSVYDEYDYDYFPRRRPCEFPPSVFPSEGLNCPGGVCYPPMSYLPGPIPGVMVMGPTVCTPAGCYPTYMPVPTPYYPPLAGLAPYPVVTSCPNIF